LLELSIFGNVHDQGWQFYAALLALFIVSSSPGFVVMIIGCGRLGQIIGNFFQINKFSVVGIRR